jgi:hypothetical protein
MSIRSKIALSLVLVLGTASAALSAPKHPVHLHRVAVERQLLGASAYGYANPANPARTTSGPYDPYNHQEVKCFGGTCNPEWGINDSE